MTTRRTIETTFGLLVGTAVLLRLFAEPTWMPEWIVQLIVLSSAVVMTFAIGYLVGALWALRKARKVYHDGINELFLSMELARRVMFVEQCRREGRDVTEIERLFRDTPLDKQYLSVPKPPLMDSDETFRRA